MVYFAKSSSGSTSTTLSWDLRPEIVRDGLLVGGERTDAAPGERDGPYGAKEATDTVDGRRAMRCVENDTSVEEVLIM